jgi:hypothetical protein
MESVPNTNLLKYVLEKTFFRIFSIFVFLKLGEHFFHTTGHFQACPLYYIQTAFKLSEYQSTTYKLLSVVHKAAKSRM